MGTALRSTLGALLAAPSLVAQQTPVAITQVSVIAMTTRGVAADQTVLIRDGRIAALGPAATVTVPAGARVVDGRGKFLIPGLTDSHVHLYDVNDLGLYLLHGVTTVLNMSGAPIHLEWRDAVARGTLLGPAIFTTGPQLKVEADPAIDFERGAGTPEEIAALVRAHAAMGYDFAKVWGAITPEQYAAVLVAAKAARLRVTGHIPRAVGLAGVITAGQSSVAHVEEFYNKVFQRRIVDSLVPAAVEATRSSGMPVVTTLVTYEAIAASLATDLTPLLSRPSRALLDPVRQLLWESSYNSFRTPGPAGRDQGYRDALGFEERISRALAEAGVPLLAGTDAGGLPGLVPGWELHRELELLVEAGLHPWEALRTATHNPGNYLTAGEFGTVSVGARADLVLLDADPLAAIANTRRIAGVVVRGRYLGPNDLSAIRQRLDSLNHATGAFVQLVMRGDGAAVQEVLGRAQAASPGVPPFQEAPVLFLAQGLRAQRQVDAAINLMRIVVAAYPRSYLGHYMLAGTLFGAGRSAEARPELEAVLRLRPDHDGAAAMLRRLGQ
jgi:imidazolonepropionase-like amidohydrolase